MTDVETENSAALACITALTEWFEPGTSNALEYLDGENAQCVTAFLFGQLVSAIEGLAEEATVTPSEYVRLLALDVNQEIYGLV
jgi:hypothetical protein